MCNIILKSELNLRFEQILVRGVILTY